MPKTSASSKGAKERKEGARGGSYFLDQNHCGGGVSEKGIWERGGWRKTHARSSKSWKPKATGVIDIAMVIAFGNPGREANSVEIGRDEKDRESSKGKNVGV